MNATGKRSLRGVLRAVLGWSAAVASSVILIAPWSAAAAADYPRDPSA